MSKATTSPTRALPCVSFMETFVEGFPRSQVVPIDRKRHDTRPLRMLHNSVINGIRRGGGKRRGVDPDEIQVPGAGSPGLVAGGMDRRRQAGELLQVDRSLEEEDPTVPGAAAVGEEPLGLCLSGLLDEPVHPEDAGSGRGPAADVAVARLRPRGGDTEGHERRLEWPISVKEKCPAFKNSTRYLGPVESS